MISDTIDRTTLSLKERGLPEDSYFEVIFPDGSMVSEKNVNWSALSQQEVVYDRGNKQMCFVATMPIKSIRIVLSDLEAMIEDIPQGTKVYQYMRSQRLLAKDIDKEVIVGRGIGLIREGSIVEERFISALENRTMGMRI